MPATDWGWLITPEELRAWILEETPDLLLVNKPPHVVVHRSRFGPWSSLVGACREYLGDDVLRKVLLQTQVGQFGKRSWAYWNYRLGLASVDDVPAMPVRRFE